MVETYKRTSNPMMNRPVVKAELVEWMRSSQTQRFCCKVLNLLSNKVE